MARRLRVQFPGAIYHIINRGNYRRDLFETADKAQAFEHVLFETSQRMRWQLFAYALMRNHFHIALATPQTNLVEGMHWLQSTYATRFNRFRKERGHVFQARYQSLLVEPGASLLRVVNYIHLNPVRAGIVPAEYVEKFRWSSLRWFARPDCPPSLSSDVWLSSAGHSADRAGLVAYAADLRAIAEGPQIQSNCDAELCSGWAIGTPMWRKALAEEHAQKPLYPGIPMAEIEALKACQWEQVLGAELKKQNKTQVDIRDSAKGAPWKIAVATTLRQHTTATNRWIAAQLHMGSPSSVSQYISRASRQVRLPPT